MKTMLLALLAATAGCGNGGATPLNHGVRVAPGRYRLLGLIDRRAIVIDLDGGVAAIGLDDGMREDIDYGSDFAVVLSHAVVTFHDENPPGGFGAATVWTPESHARVLDRRVMFSPMASTADGTALIYLRLADDASGAALMFARTDGATPILVADNAGDFATCQGRMAAAAQTLFARYCTAGATSSRLVAIDAQSGKSIELISGGPGFFALDGDGARLLVSGPGSHGQLIDAQGNPIFELSANPGFGYLWPDASAAVYRADGALRRWDQPKADVTLLSSTVFSLTALSADRKWVQFTTRRDDYRRYSDLQLASTERPGAPIVLSALPTAATFGDAFTDDGARTLFATDCTTAFIGVLKSMPVAGGDATVLANDVWRWRTVSSAQVIVAADWMPVPRRRGEVDIVIADAAGGATTTIAERAEADFELVSARTEVVYSWMPVADQEGLYRATIQ